MIIPDHKKTVSVILSKMGQKPDEKENMGENVEALHVAAEDLINAIHDKNALAVAEALKAFIELHESHEKLEE